MAAAIGVIRWRTDSMIPEEAKHVVPMHCDRKRQTLSLCSGATKRGAISVLLIFTVDLQILIGKLFSK